MMRNHPHRDSLPYFRLTALVAALALTLPAPLGAAPADHLRTGQAAGTAVGLEKLPRALGGAPTQPGHAGLEEDWRETLRQLSTVEGGLRRLTPGQAVRIPMAGFDALPKKSLTVCLADRQHTLTIVSTDEGLLVTAGKAVLPAPVTLKPGTSWVAGRAGKPSDERIVFPGDRQSGEGVVSGDHLRVGLVRDSHDAVTLHLTDLASTNGTYLTAESVAMLLRGTTPPVLPPALRLTPRGGGFSTGAGLEEGASPEDILDQFLNERVPLPQPSRIFLEGFPEGAQEWIPAGDGETVSDLKLAMGDLPEGSRLVWESVMPQATERRLHLIFLPLVREQLFRRLGDVLVGLSKHLAEDLPWNQAAYEAMSEEVSRHWASRGGRPEWRRDLVADQIRHLMASLQIAVWMQGDQLARAPAWLAAAAAVAAQKDSGHSALDGAMPITVAEVQAQLTWDAAAAQEPSAPLGAEGETFLNTVLSAAQSAAGLEEGAGEAMRIVVVWNSAPLRDAVRETATRWGQAQQARHGGTVTVEDVEVGPGFPSLLEGRPCDVILLAVDVRSALGSAPSALRSTVPELARIAARDGAKLGMVVVAPESLQRLFLSRWLDDKVTSGDVHAVSATDTMPAATDLGLQSTVYRLANDAFAQRRAARAQIVEFLNVVQRPGALWSSGNVSGTDGVVLTDARQGSCELSLLLVDLQGKLSMVVVVRRPDGRPLGPAAEPLQQYTFQALDDVTGEVSAPRQLEGGRDAEARLAALLSPFNGQASVKHAFFTTFDLSQFQCVRTADPQKPLAMNRFRVRVAGPGLPATDTGLEEAAVEQAVRTEADPTFGQYY